MNRCLYFMVEFLAYVMMMLLASLESSMAHHHHAPATAPIQVQTTFDVLKFGAIGDGKTDDSKAFQLAWQAACENNWGSAKIIVPVAKTFLVSAIKFEGPCQCPSVTFEILGIIVAPPKLAWNKMSDEWLYFHDIDGLAVVGNGLGVIDGRGDSWWGKEGNSGRPTALRFSHCNDLQVSGLKHINSQKNHISVNNCNNTSISSLHIIAPPTSPNTDGVDISSSTNLVINNCTIETGDDCIAMDGVTSKVNISEITCGPGHGISIGSLGRSKEEPDQVEQIYVTNCTFKETENGLRIKTIPGGSGFARNINFSEIIFMAADNPVIIDQFYSNNEYHDTKGSDIKISDVRYTGLRGTSNCDMATINFDCSQVVPCTNLVVEDVDIKPANPKVSPLSARCINAHGIARDTLSPVVNCLNI